MPERIPSGYYHRGVGELSTTSPFSYMLELPASWRLSIIVFYTLVATLWAYYNIRPRPAGIERFVAALPIAAGHLVVPLLLKPGQEIVAIAAVSLSISWLSLFKVFAH